MKIIEGNQPGATYYEVRFRHGGSEGWQTYAPAGTHSNAQAAYDEFKRIEDIAQQLGVQLHIVRVDVTPVKVEP